MRFGRVCVFPFALLALVVLGGRAMAAPTALEVFQNFQRVFAKTEAIAADFEETTLMDGEKRTAKGQILFKKPNLLRQTYLDPNDPLVTAQLIVLDGKMSWSYTPWLNQVTRKRMNPNGDAELLPGAGKDLEKIPENYDLRLKEDEEAAKQGIYLLELRPKPDKIADASEETLEVWIRGEDWVPVQFAYTNVPNDVVTVIKLTKLDLNAKPSPEDFTFVPPKGVEVVTITDDYKSDD